MGGTNRARAKDEEKAPPSKCEDGAPSGWTGNRGAARTGRISAKVPPRAKRLTRRPRRVERAEAGREEETGQRTGQKGKKYM